jgi:hypothetical protein
MKAVRSINLQFIVRARAVKIGAELDNNIIIYHDVVSVKNLGRVGALRRPDGSSSPRQSFDLTGIAARRPYQKFSSCSRRH